MELIACSLYLLLIVLVGYVAVSLICPSDRLGIVELATLTSATGAGTMGLLLFWASLMGLAPSRTLLVIFAMASALALVALGKKRGLARLRGWPADWQRADGWVVVPLVLVLAGMMMVVVVGVSAPLSELDAYAIWSFKAKVLAHEALRPVPAYFHDPNLSFSHLDYPLMLPMLTAGAYAAMGTVDDQTAKLVCAFLDVLVVPLVYLGLRWKLRRLPAMCLTATLAMLPALLYQAGSGCADATLAMFYAGSVIYVVRWIESQRRQDLALAILFSAFTAFTKNEGAVLALINSLVILGFGLRRYNRRAWAGAVIFIIGLLLLNAAWFAWSRGLPHTDEGYGSKLFSTLLVRNFSRWEQILQAMIEQTVTLPLWGLVWVAAGVTALLGWRATARRYLLAAWCLLVLHLAAYVLTYIVTPWNLASLLHWTLTRLLLHAVPVVVLLWGWYWGELETPGQPAVTTGFKGSRHPLTHTH